MIQTKISVMASTVKLSVKGLDLVDAARRKKGWTKASQTWADLAITSKATLKRFWAGIAIKTETFQGICIAVGVEDWEKVADLVQPNESDETRNADSKKSKKRWVIELDADFEKIDSRKLIALIHEISELGDTVMKIVDIDEGSIKLLFEGSSEDIEKIQELIESGKVKDVLDTPVKRSYILNQTDSIQNVDQFTAEQSTLRNVLTNTFTNKQINKPSWFRSVPPIPRLLSKVLSSTIDTTAVVAGVVLSTIVLDSFTSESNLPRITDLGILTLNITFLSLVVIVASICLVLTPILADIRSEIRGKSSVSDAISYLLIVNNVNSFGVAKVSVVSACFASIAQIGDELFAAIERGTLSSFFSTLVFSFGQRARITDALILGAVFSTVFLLIEWILSRFILSVILSAAIERKRQSVYKNVLIVIRELLIYAIGAVLIGFIIGKTGVSMAKATYLNPVVVRYIEERDQQFIVPRIPDLPPTTYVQPVEKG